MTRKYKHLSCKDNKDQCIQKISYFNNKEKHYLIAIIISDRLFDTWNVITSLYNRIFYNETNIDEKEETCYAFINKQILFSVKNRFNEER